MKAAQLVDRFSQEGYARLTRRILVGAGVAVRGQPLWIGPDVYFDVGVAGAITIGDRCVISKGVRLLTHDFSLDRVGELKVGRSDQELVSRGPITIGDYAFVGMGSIILPNVRIGRGSVIGSGSVVTRDVPDNRVAAGNPARVIKTTDEYWDERLDSFDWQQRRR